MVVHDLLLADVAAAAEAAVSSVIASSSFVCLVSSGSFCEPARENEREITD